MSNEKNSMDMVHGQPETIDIPKLNQKIEATSVSIVQHFHTKEEVVNTEAPSLVDPLPERANEQEENPRLTEPVDYPVDTATTTYRDGRRMTIAEAASHDEEKLASGIGSEHFNEPHVRKGLEEWKEVSKDMVDHLQKEIDASARRRKSWMRRFWILLILLIVGSAVYGFLKLAPKKYQGNFFQDLKGATSNITEKAYDNSWGTGKGGVQTQTQQNPQATQLR